MLITNLFYILFGIGLGILLNIITSFIFKKEPVKAESLYENTEILKKEENEGREKDYITYDPDFDIGPNFFLFNLKNYLELEDIEEETKITLVKHLIFFTEFKDIPLDTWKMLEIWSNYSIFLNSAALDSEYVVMLKEISVQVQEVIFKMTQDK